MAYKLARNCKDKDFYTKAFIFGDSALTRQDLESCPAPVITAYFSDWDMNILVQRTELSTKGELGLSDDEHIDFDDEYQSETWWRNLEETMNALFDVRYYEDLEDDEYKELIAYLNN